MTARPAATGRRADEDVSQKFGLSPGRVSQPRRDFLEDWRRFTEEVGC
jgi:hypothetical protein